MKCSARTATGEGCFAEAQHDSIYCVMHDDRPEARRRHLEMSSRGGQRAHRPDPSVDVTIDVSSADGILKTLAAVGSALASGRLDRSRANALSYIAATATQVLKVHRFEERVRRIEERLGLKEVDDDDDGNETT